MYRTLLLPVLGALALALAASPAEAPAARADRTAGHAVAAAA